MKIAALGEIMLRLAPNGYNRFVQADSFGATYGGAEANVAVSLAGFGMNAAFVTKVPDHEIGQAAVNALRKYGVNTENIVRGGERLGIYFIEKGASQRPSKVIYDRRDSAFAMAMREEFNWGEILRGVDWFHVTGITPALSDVAADICLDAVKCAKEMGITVSFDPNYRANLWSMDKAGKVISEIMEYVDVCITNVDQVADVFSITGENDVEVAARLCERFGLSYVAMTERKSFSASDNNYSAMLYHSESVSRSREYAMHIVDRVGGGDGFAAGLIYSVLCGKTDKEAIEFAVAAGCLKHTVEGDFNLVSASEVESLAGGDTTGRVKR